jgi:hypothetical protein
MHHLKGRENLNFELAPTESSVEEAKIVKEIQRSLKAVLPQDHDQDMIGEEEKNDGGRIG